MIMESTKEADASKTSSIETGIRDRDVVWASRSSGTFVIPKRSRRRRKVRFREVEIRNYSMTYSVNPYCATGPPVGLDWNYTTNPPIDINLFEATRLQRRPLHDLLLDSYQRRDKLLSIAGMSIKEIDEVTKEVAKVRRQRLITSWLMPMTVIGETFSNILNRMRRSDDNSEVSKTSRTESTEIAEIQTLHPVSSKVDRVRFSAGSELDTSRSRTRSRSHSDADCSSSATSDEPFIADTRLFTSQDSEFLRYDVLVDRTQSDKALQIKLCSMKRPHMRAFHASWFSFFVAFFAWFAITPLLAEVQETLKISDRDIWTSSLWGSASTIVMRIIIGPLCDKFGARLCMAVILLISSIPTAMTGLVQTSTGLSIVRAFIGIAGASFVACQYWASSMFTKEIAGTANAFVAGWGNLGGGMAQIVIGSIMFPALKWVYAQNNTDTAEVSTRAWRTVFIVPALMSAFTAFFIVFYCDDLPKGNLRKRMKERELLEISSAQVLWTVVRSRTSWILFFQYACCFGIEVTMTNAVAKFFKDKYYQSTETSAAIASTFGFMNIFARGLGGFASDTCNGKLGIRGRLLWQFTTLFLEGMAIIWFSYTNTMLMSIVALGITSLCVQFAEGSTFGIVPYVNRRCTGGVVGFVAAGGNVGGVIFAILFHHFDYSYSFRYMGLTVIAVSFISFFLKVNKDAFFHNADLIRVLIRNGESNLRLPVVNDD